MYVLVVIAELANRQTPFVTFFCWETSYTDVLPSFAQPAQSAELWYEYRNIVIMWIQCVTCHMSCTRNRLMITYTNVNLPSCAHWSVSRTSQGMARIHRVRAAPFPQNTVRKRFGFLDVASALFFSLASDSAVVASSWSRSGTICLNLGPRVSTASASGPL